MVRFIEYRLGNDQRRPTAVTVSGLHVKRQPEVRHLHTRTGTRRRYYRKRTLKTGTR